MLRQSSSTEYKDTKRNDKKTGFASWETSKLQKNKLKKPW